MPALTLNLKTITDEFKINAPDVSVSLAATGRLLLSTTRPVLVCPTTPTLSIDDQGEATLHNLLASVDYLPPQAYSIKVGTLEAIVFYMPASDSNLYDILLSDYVPEGAGVGGAVQLGWIPRTADTDPPPAPVHGLGDLVVEDGQLRVWNAVTRKWVAVAGGGGGTTLPSFLQAGTEVLHSRAGALFWDGVNEVPSTPGEASGVGHVLTVTGENDRDYAWRTVNGYNDAQVKADIAENRREISEEETARRDADTAITRQVEGVIRGMGDIRQLPVLPAAGSRDNKIPKFDGDVLGWETDAGGGGGADATARAAAAAAQLEADTVIEVGPAFMHNNRSARNLSVSIRHPSNAYSMANQMSIAAAGQSPVRVEYKPGERHQGFIVEISASQMGNIWDQVDRIPDGDGGFNTVQRFGVGDFIPVDIRLEGPPPSGQQRVNYFFRQIRVLVVDPDTFADQVARGGLSENKVEINALEARTTALGYGFTPVALTGVTDSTTIRKATIPTGATEFMAQRADSTAPPVRLSLPWLMSLTRLSQEPRIVVGAANDEWRDIRRNLITGGPHSFTVVEAQVRVGIFGTSFYYSLNAPMSPEQYRFFWI